MGLLKELREAAPLAEALANATLDAAEGLRQAGIAAATIKIPTMPAAGSEGASAATAPRMSSGGGGAGGGGGGGSSLVAPPQLVRAVDRSLQPRSIDWLNQHCERTTFLIPNPKNRNAAAENDMVNVAGWDCSGELRMIAKFYDPADMARLRGDPSPMSSRNEGGGASGSGGMLDALGRGQRQLNHGTHQVGGTFGGSSASGAPVTSGPVQVTDPAMAEQTRLLREIRDQGRQDAGLGRRVGGRP